MDASATTSKTLYLVCLLLMTFNLLTWVRSHDEEDVWFSLRNKTYRNNSCVTLEDIGEGDNALLCMTTCCQASYTGTGSALGNWYFPNGTTISRKIVNVTSEEQGDIYSTRDQSVVRLNRKRDGEEGIYRCEIPNSTNVTQTIILYIGVYRARSVLTSETTPPLTISCSTQPTKGATATTGTVPVSSSTQPTNTSGATTRTRTVVVSSSIQPTKTVGATATTRTAPVSSSIQPTKTVGAPTTTTRTLLVSSSIQPTKTVGAPTTTTRTLLVSSSIQPTKTVGALTTTTRTLLVSSSIQPTKIVGALTTTTRTLLVSSSIQPTKTVGALTTTTRTLLVSSSIQPTKTVGALTTTTRTLPVNSSILPTKILGATTTTGTVLVSRSTQHTPSDGQHCPSQHCHSGTVPVSSRTQPTTTRPPHDGATTTLVIIVVAVVSILVVIVVGVVILVFIFRAKKRKQQLEVNKLQSVTEAIEMKLKQEGIEKEADHPPYTIIQTKAPPNVPSKSEELVDYLNRSSILPGEYSEIELVQDDSKHVLPAKPPRRMNYSDPTSKDMESNPVYHDVDQHCDPSSTTNVVRGNDIYTVPDATTSYTVEAGNETYETVYSEPIQPSLFADADRTPSDSQNAQPYAPIYTVPTDLPRSEEVVLKVFRSNIREICELGMGLFGKVILAETVGLSAKDLRLSESDDDKSKSTLVAVKKLKSDAPNATKEAFEKEVNFMSRLTDRNVIRILGVCYEDAPFIMMEYMEKGDLNQYLQKFKILSTTDSEPQGQITTKTLVHIATQIASAMKYLASHNFVHRDLATRNCLVGPNYLVKISDFGMSRSLYDSHYYRIHGRFALPVRWMAHECFYGKFSQKSDVWAFGVTMWEIFTLAKEQPYNNMSDMQVIEDALKGKNRKILPKPDMCLLKVYKIMLECWEHNSDQRATFDELFQLLTSIHSNI